MFESLKLTIERTLPYWNDVIVPQIKEGKKVREVFVSLPVSPKLHGFYAQTLCTTTSLRS